MHTLATFALFVAVIDAAGIAWTLTTNYRNGLEGR